MKNIPKYRFFYHYRRSENKLSVHFRKQCIPVADVECLVPTESKWNKIQPYLVIQGFARSVRVENDKAIIE